MISDKTELISKSTADLKQASKSILEFAGPVKVWIFYGDMGAGKTTFIKEICNTLGVIDVVTSPTFSLVNEYENQQGDQVFHFDFYRIKNEREALDIGIEDYFYSGNYCFIEWPSKIPNLIPEEHLEITISEINSERHIQVIKK